MIENNDVCSLVFEADSVYFFDQIVNYIFYSRLLLILHVLTEVYGLVNFF